MILGKKLLAYTPMTADFECQEYRSHLENRVNDSQQLLSLRVSKSVGSRSRSMAWN